MDKQRDMMAALRFMLFEQQRMDGIELPRGQLNTEKSKLLTMLNWIASIFVTEPVGDVVATAVSAEQGRITFYIAANRGPSRELDRNNVEIFKQLLRDTIDLDHPKEELITQLLSVVSPMVYPRLSRKVDLITGIDETESPGSRVQDRFNQVVDRWTKEGNVEDDPTFLSKSQELGLDVNERLKLVLDRIALTATTDASAGGGRPKDDKTRRLRVADFTSDAYALLQSHFFKSFDEHRKYSDDFIWISRLRRRLWRVSRYATDLLTVVKFGLPYIRCILGKEGSRTFADGGAGVEIVWVGDQLILPDNHGRDITMSLSPMEFLNKFFDKFEYKAKGKKKRPMIPPEIVADIGKFWGSEIRPFLHCELQMILYLQANKIQVQNNAIGNTKLMCWACNEYVARANKGRGLNAWQLSGTSEKSHCAWLIPSSPLGDAVVRDVMKDLGPFVRQFAVEFGHHPLSDSGRDSDGFTVADRKLLSDVLAWAQVPRKPC